MKFIILWVEKSEERTLSQERATHYVVGSKEELDAWCIKNPGLAQKSTVYELGNYMVPKIKTVVEYEPVPATTVCVARF